MIAWLWARTVKSPNPAFADVDVPLASTFMLSTKKGKEAYVEPVIEGRKYRFTVKAGTPSDVELQRDEEQRCHAVHLVVCCLACQSSTPTSTMKPTPVEWVSV